MPSLTRERGPATRTRRAPDDEFVLFLQGIPAHCRWQELKDLVRQTALHIRQAVVYDDQHGFPTGLGQIIVKNEDEAWRTYHRLSSDGWDGQTLVVTLARTSLPTKPIAGPIKSSSCVFPRGYARACPYSTPSGRFARNLNFPLNSPFPPSPMTSEAPVMPPSPTPTYPPRECIPMYQGPMNTYMGMNMNIGPPRQFAHHHIHLPPTIITDPTSMTNQLHCFPLLHGIHPSSAFDPLTLPVGSYMYPPPPSPMQSFKLHESQRSHPAQDFHFGMNIPNFIDNSSSNGNGHFHIREGVEYGHGIPSISTRLPDNVYHQQHHQQVQQTYNCQPQMHHSFDYDYPQTRTQAQQQQQQRTITIQNLNPTTTTEVLKHLFHYRNQHQHQHEHYTIEHCEIYYDYYTTNNHLSRPESESSSASKSKSKSVPTAHARIILGTPEEAKQAVLSFDNTIFMGRGIRVVPGFGLDSGVDAGFTSSPLPASVPVADVGSASDSGSVPTTSAQDAKLAISNQNPNISEQSNTTLVCYARDDDNDTGSVDERKRKQTPTQKSKPEPESDSNESRNKIGTGPETRKEQHQQPLIINGSGIGVGTMQ